MSAAPRALVAESGLYLHTTAYSVVLGGIIVLVPLYIISLGYNPGWLGESSSLVRVFSRWRCGSSAASSPTASASGG